jgi:hypothetical protein
MEVGIFEPRYFGSVGYYAAMAACDLAVIDYDMRYDKRMKCAHRMDIADTRGKLTLTMPVSRPNGVEHLRWSDILISAHGNWWDVQRGAIESAYGRTPFFEYYFDRFKPFFTDQVPGSPLVAHLAGIDAVIREILGLKTRVSCTLPANLGAANVTDYRRCDFADGEPYTQIRAKALGFIDGLSILDKIFNVGADCL